MNIRQGVLSAFCIAFTTGCLEIPAVQKPTSNTIVSILAQAPSTWTHEQCDKVIMFYKAHNKRGYERLLTSGGHSSEEVYVQATPLNKYVISARVRKQAINRRLSDSEFKQRLRHELAAYTRWTLDDSGKAFVPRETASDSLANEATFVLHFENISDPHRTIEVFRAEEGFFLENKSGEFSRVTAVSSQDANEYFILVSDLSLEVTFSLTTDSGKKLNYSDRNYRQFKIILNGLQKGSISVEW